MPEKCVDLIYIDPPWNSGRNYEIFWGETQEKRSFDDRHESTQAYIDYMRPRCEQLERVLKPTGSFYYHCDWHASHYVKVMLDQIFGENNFQCEIIWQRTLSKGLAFTGFLNIYYAILYYGGGGKLSFTLTTHTTPIISTRKRPRNTVTDTRMDEYIGWTILSTRIPTARI